MHDRSNKPSLSCAYCRARACLHWMTTYCGHSEDADGAMASDLSGAGSGTRVPNEPEPRMPTADAARYCGFRSSRGLLAAWFEFLFMGASAGEIHRSDRHPRCEPVDFGARSAIADLAPGAPARPIGTRAATLSGW